MDLPERLGTLTTESTDVEHLGTLTKGSNDVELLGTQTTESNDVKHLETLTKMFQWLEEHDIRTKRGKCCVLSKPVAILYMYIDLIMKQIHNEPTSWKLSRRLRQ